MVMQFHSNDPRFRTTEVGTELGPRLTSREWDVLAGLAEGLSTRDIGRRLQLKPSGVRAHISAVVQKLGVEGPPRGGRFLPRDIERLNDSRLLDLSTS